MVCSAYSYLGNVESCVDRMFPISICGRDMSDVAVRLWGKWGLGVCLRLSQQSKTCVPLAATIIVVLYSIRSLVKLTKAFVLVEKRLVWLKLSIGQYSDHWESDEQCISKAHGNWEAIYTKAWRLFSSFENLCTKSIQGICTCCCCRCWSSLHIVLPLSVVWRKRCSSLSFTG